MHTNRYNGDPPYAIQATVMLEPTADSFALIGTTTHVAHGMGRDGFRDAKPAWSSSISAAPNPCRRSSSRRPIRARSRP